MIKQKGFTLIELIIVMAVLAVLAAVVTLNVAGYVSRSKERAWDADQRMVQSAVDAYRTDAKRRTGNPWPILAAPTLPAGLQPGPDINNTARGYIDIAVLASSYLKSAEAVRCANTNNNTSATNRPSGNYSWYIDSTGVVNAWADANDDGSYTSGESGFQAGIYP